jgi:hypothetical protein
MIDDDYYFLVVRREGGYYKCDVMIDVGLIWYLS